MAKLEGASAGVKDVIGEDGKHFFELLRLGQEAKELAAVLEARVHTAITDGQGHFALT